MVHHKFGKYCSLQFAALERLERMYAMPIVDDMQSLVYER